MGQAIGVEEFEESHGNMTEVLFFHCAGDLHLDSIFSFKDIIAADGLPLDRRFHAHILTFQLVSTLKVTTCDTLPFSCFVSNTPSKRLYLRLPIMDECDLLRRLMGENGETLINDLHHHLL